MGILILSSSMANALELGTTKGSANYQTGIALAKTLNTAGIKITPIPHSGTNAYMEKMDIGKIDLGLAGVYNLNWGYKGYGPFKKPLKNLRFVANLEPFFTAMCVPVDSDIKTYQDLKGKRLPSEFKAAPNFHFLYTYMLRNANLTYNDVKSVPIASLGKSWEALAKGRIDAAMFAIGSGAAKKYNTQVNSGIRCLSNNEGKLEHEMLKDWGGVKVVELKPSPKFPLVREPIRVQKFNYTLFAHKDVSKEIVYKIVTALYQNADVFRTSSGLTSTFNKSEMHDFELVPMHEGAVDAYISLGLIKIQ